MIYVRVHYTKASNGHLHALVYCLVLKQVAFAKWKQVQFTLWSLDQKNFFGGCSDDSIS